MAAPQIVPMNLTDFIHFVATRKKSLKDWAYLHVKVPAANFGETMQLLHFHIHEYESALVDLSPGSEFLMITSTKNSAALALFEKEVSESFGKENISIDARGLASKGLERIAEIVTPYIGNNHAAALGLRRMVRLGNTIVALDDDVMIMRLIQNTMGGLGHVITTQDHAEFIREYKEYAPNIAFIDIHLRDGLSGIKVMQDLIRTVDPYAHIIMISSDSQPKTIEDLKNSKGAKGFILKPIKREALLAHMTKAPTFHMRETQ